MPEPLQSFKVGEKLKKTTSAPKAEATPPASLFSRVEALIDEYETSDQAKEVFADSISRLEGLLAAEKNPKKKAEIVKAKRAFEHTMSTLDYLFQVKAELAQAMPAQAATGKKKK